MEDSRFRTEFYMTMMMMMMMMMMLSNPLRMLRYKGKYRPVYRSHTFGIIQYCLHNTSLSSSSYLIIMHQIKSATQACTNVGSQVAWVTKLCTVTPNMFRSSVQNLLHVTLLVPRALKWPLDYWKICAPLQKQQLSFPTGRSDDFSLLTLGIWQPRLPVRTVLYN
jgi:hypothetical protein